MSLLLAIISYLIGSIPMGFILSEVFFKKDVRTMGSGNIGATNIFRNFGKVPGLLTFLLDFAKGYLAVFIGSRLLDEKGKALALLFVVLGHMYSIFLHFKAGKGISTAFGGILFIDKRIALALLVVFIIIFIIFRIVSLSSISAALLAGILGFYWYGLSLFSIILLIVAILVEIRHKDNIKRLLRGEEKKLF
ncbi:MAG: glycerol-3-phosphate 1-O-acyltransferase PlsY [Anaerococcus sp.]|nr:glycerol-3-phosphate 1-O-acyltransferase PlsY [Anaerococcus sp.]